MSAVPMDFFQLEASLATVLQLIITGCSIALHHEQLP